MSDDEKPGLARAARGRTGPFAALLARATRDPEAAGAIAMAYAALDVVARRRLVDAVVADAQAEHVAPGLALVSLLAVEEDADNARAIAMALSMTDPGALAVRGLAHARLGGDDQRGAAVLVRPLHAGFVEALAVRWDATTQELGATVEPLLRADQDFSFVRFLGDDVTLEPSPMAYVVDMLAGILWRHRRAGGEIPAGLVRFADLF